MINVSCERVECDFWLSGQCSHSGTGIFITKKGCAMYKPVNKLKGRPIRPGDFEIKAKDTFILTEEGEDGYSFWELTALRNIDEILGTSMATGYDEGIEAYISVSDDFTRINPIMHILRWWRGECAYVRRILSGYEQAVLLNLTQCSRINELQRELEKLKAELEVLSFDELVFE